MSLSDLPLKELLKRAALETDHKRLQEMVQEINQRYTAQDREMQFDIFSGVPNREAIWLESVTGLAAANERMQQTAAAAPGAYFVFHSPSRRVLAKLDNGPVKAVGEENPAKTGTETA